MHGRSVLTACTAVVLVSLSNFGIRADDKTLLIELEERSHSLPPAVSASGAVVAGGLNENGGAFYWMPTPGVVFAGGGTADGVSRDGPTTAGSAPDSRGIKQRRVSQR